MKAILVNNCVNCPHRGRRYVVKPYKGYQIQCELTLTPNFVIKVVGMENEINEPPAWCPLQEAEELGIKPEDFTISKEEYTFSISDRKYVGKIPKFKKEVKNETGKEASNS